MALGQMIVRRNSSGHSFKAAFALDATIFVHVKAGRCYNTGATSAIVCCVFRLPTVAMSCKG